MRHVYVEVWLAAMGAVCAAALRWGGGPERRTAALFVLAWAATLAVQRMTGEAAPVTALAVVDAGAFLVLLVFSWRDRETWLVAAVGCQALALAVHMLRALSPAMPPWTYLTALAASSYGLLATLAWGTWRRMRREVHLPIHS